MLNDVPFEAAFLRAAVLVGLVHEREVPDWAAGLLHTSSPSTPRLADVAAERIELSAIRESLRPVAASADLSRVASSILTAVAIEQTLHPRPAVDLVNMLGQIRQEFRCHLPEATAARIKAFENRLMFAQAGVTGQAAPGSGEIAALLDEVRAPGHFRFYFSDLEELLTFVAGLSRRIARDRTSLTGQSSRGLAHAWLLRDPEKHADLVVLDEPAALVAAREFAPVPAASRIPYDPASTAAALPIISGDSVTALGVDDVRSRLAV